MFIFGAASMVEKIDTFDRMSSVFNMALIAFPGKGDARELLSAYSNGASVAVGA